MSQNKWDLDELLNFDYGKPVPDERPSAAVNKTRGAEEINKSGAGSSRYDEARLYAEQRRAEQEKQLRLERERQLAEQQRQQYAQQQEQLRLERERQLAEQQRQQAYERAAQAEAQRLQQLEAKRREDQRRAQAEAYERYRSETKNSGTGKVARANAGKKANSIASRLTKEKAATAAAKATGILKFTKPLSVVYLVFMAAFTLVMTIMNVLPFKYLLLLYLLMGILSTIIVMQLTKPNIKKWARRLSTVLSIVLIIVFGTGTLYALGTLSFLSSTSVKNDKRVGSITNEPFNIYITGMDVYGTINQQDGRSDVNMILTVNPKTETILITSIPRDYEIRMVDEGYQSDKLTHTGFYGVDTTLSSAEDLLQTDINYYVKVNFSTVRFFIDNIGGVDVYSEYEFNPVKLPEYTVKKGMNHMDGEQAMAFARERKAFEDGDNQRVKNQQAVFEAMLDKAMSSKTILLRYNRALNNLKDYFEMSLSSSEIRALIKMQIARNIKWKIYKNQIHGIDQHKATYSGGSQPLYVMGQSEVSLTYAKELINAVLDGKTLTKKDDGIIVFEGSTYKSAQKLENKFNAEYAQKATTSSPSYEEEEAERQSSSEDSSSDSSSEGSSGDTGGGGEEVIPETPTE